MNDVAKVADSLISDEMRGLIGRELRSRLSYPISASDIRKWALAVYYPERPPEQFLRAGGPSDPLVAPEEFNPFAWTSPGATGKPPDIKPGFMERGAGIKPPDLQFMVNGGSVCEYGVRMYEGDVIRASFTPSGYSQKQGKRGPLLFTETKDIWTNQRGEMVRTTTSTVISY
jgi:hypothetical protein